MLLIISEAPISHPFP
jgi:hypothetical protein